MERKGAEGQPFLTRSIYYPQALGTALTATEVGGRVPEKDQKYQLLFLLLGAILCPLRLEASQMQHILVYPVDMVSTWCSLFVNHVASRCFGFQMSSRNVQALLRFDDSFKL